MGLYIGLDLGTTKLAGVLYDSERNKIRKMFSYPHNALRVSGPFYEIDVDKTIRLADAILKKIGFGKKINGIGISTQMHGCLFVDRYNRSQGCLITWQDQRCLLPYPGEPGKNFLQKIIEMTGEDVFYNTGTKVSTGFLGPTVFWFHKKRLLPKGAKVCFLGDYLASILTGEPVSPDVTCAGSSGFYDIKRKEWLWSVIERLGIPPEVFPKVGETGSVLGFSKNTAVLRAIGDNQASIIGSAGYLDKTLLLNVGTGSQSSLKVDKFLRHKGLDTRYFMNQDYLLVGAALSGGKTLAIAERFLAEIGRKIFNKNENLLYEKMKGVLKTHKNVSSHMLCGPFFAGTREDPDKKGFLALIREENFRLSDFLFSLMEGIIFEIYSFYEKMGSPEISRVVGAGNGMRRNPLLGEIAANLFHKPLVISRIEEEAAAGSAFLAASRLEKGFNINGALKSAGYGKAFNPEKKKAGIYQERYRIYRKMEEILS